MAAAQGTMNNLVWGDDRYQYYETIFTTEAQRTQR
jgi:N-methylhydantoinase B/oxoprolinase/acetone carboxylase alpha subunit